MFFPRVIKYSIMSLYDCFCLYSNIVIKSITVFQQKNSNKKNTYILTSKKIINTILSQKCFNMRG
jgi:hypothetical protein